VNGPNDLLLRAGDYGGAAPSPRSPDNDRSRGERRHGEREVDRLHDGPTHLWKAEPPIWPTMAAVLRLQPE
jgi:hypothetical protein